MTPQCGVRTTPRLRNIKQFGKKVHIHVLTVKNLSKLPSSYWVIDRHNPPQGTETDMDPEFPVVVYDTPKLSYKEALKFCPYGLCKFHFFSIHINKEIKGLH